MLSQAYHWTLADIRKLTYAQAIMWQHAATHNRKVLDLRLEEGRKRNSLSSTEALADADLYGGKRLEDLTSAELIALAGNENGRKPRVIKLRKDPEPDADPPAPDQSE